MNDPTEILRDGADVYETKNDDYGDSWRQIGEVMQIFAGEDGIELETKEDFISFGLFTRRFDKLVRAFHGEFVSDGLNFESVEDAHADESVYAAMHAANQRDRADEVEYVNEKADPPDCAIDHPTVQVETDE
jgi:hypothetical protein